MFSIIVEPNSIPTDSTEVFIFLKTLLTLIFLTPYAITVRFILFGGIILSCVCVCASYVTVSGFMCLVLFYFFFFAAMFFLDVIEMNV